MGDYDYSVNIKTNVDMSDAKRKLDELQTGIKAKPMEFKVGVQDLKLGNFTNFLDKVKSGTTDVEKISVTYRNFKDVVNNATYSVPIRAYQELRNAQGETLKSTQALSDGLKAAQGIARTKGIVEEARTTATYNPGQVAREATIYYNGLYKSIDKTTESADKFMAKSESMSGKQVVATRAVASELIKEGKAFHDAFAEKNWTQVKTSGNRIEELRKQFVTLEASTKRGAGAVRGWADNLGNAIKQTISYSLSLGALRVAQQMLAQAMKYTIDLNTEMVKIQVLQAEGAQTDEEIFALANSYNTLAKSLGSTTMEIAKGSVEWLRQGKTIEETTQLMVSSTQLSKLGALSAADATEYLTSTLNSYKMEAKDASSVVDKLVAVDNIAATSTRELATALRYSAATASEAGVSLEQLISYIGVVSSTTRQNAESIGQGMKTMFTRMQDIKAGAIDEDGLGLNNVEIALDRVNIKLRDGEKSFRDMGAVLEDVAAKWKDLDDIEQANISKAIAGVRQQNLFAVIMGNMGEAIKLQNAQLSAAGLAADRYQIYLKSVEAAQNRVTSSMEALWQQGISSGLITDILNLSSEFIDLIASLGGLKFILGALTASFIVFKAQVIGGFIASIPALLASLSSAGVALTGFMVGATNASATMATLGITTSALATGGLSLLVVAVVAVGAALYYASQEAERNAKAFTELNTSAKEASAEYNKLKNSKSSIEELWKEMEKLRDIESKTEEQTKRLIEVQNELNNLSAGSLAGSYDELLNFTIDQKETLEDVNSLLTEQLALQKEIALQESKKASEAGDKTLSDLGKSIEEKEKLLAEGGKWNATTGPGGRIVRQFDPLDAKERLDLETKINKDKLAELSTVQQIVDTYNKLESFEEKASFVADLNSPQAIAGIKAIRDAWSGKGYVEARESFIEGTKLPVKVEVDNDTLIKAIDDIKSKFAKLDEIQLKIGQGEVSSDITKGLDDLGIKWEELDGKISITEEEVRRFKETSLSAINDQYLLNETQDSMWSEFNSTLNQNIMGIDMTSAAYQYAANDISSSMFTASQNAQLALYDINGTLLSSAENVKSAMLTDYRNFAVLIEQMASKSLISLAQVKSYLTGVTSYIGGATPYKPIVPTFVGGSGSSSGAGESPEKKRIEAEIESLENKKKALEDQLDEFDKYIDAQKELLRLQKEEKEFTDSLLKQNMSLAKLKAQIAVLALDDSEEAKAQRLKLEEDASALEIEIEENKEDRKYDLQMEALDKAKDDFDDRIKDQVAGIDVIIKKYQDESSQINSTSGAVGGLTDAVYDLEQQTKNYLENAKVVFKELFNLSDTNNLKLQSQINKWFEMGLTIDEVNQKAFAYSQHLANLQNPSFNNDSTRAYKNADGQYVKYHDGGVVESHHNGDFAGNLKSNEVMSKLLKGELVATEGQMDNFLKNTLPKIASYPTITSKSTGGKMEFIMPITIQGNADKSTIQDIKKISKIVIKEINDTMSNRGYIRQTNLTSI